MLGGEQELGRLGRRQLSGLNSNECRFERFLVIHGIHEEILGGERLRRVYRTGSMLASGTGKVFPLGSSGITKCRGSIVPINPPEAVFPNGRIVRTSRSGVRQEGRIASGAIRKKEGSSRSRSRVIHGLLSGVEKGLSGVRAISIAIEGGQRRCRCVALASE